MNTTTKPINLFGAVALLTLAGPFLLEGGAARAQSPGSQGRSDTTVPIIQNDSKETDVRVPVTFTGGHDTDPRDGGRPVALIAAALGVPSEVFRATFRNVTPASGGREPDPAQVNRNKEALLRGLGPYGVTNDRLDTVSNFYRYNGSRGEMWRNAPAAAYATVRHGKVVGFTITNPGFGYSSPPSISVPGMANLHATATLAFGADFRKNGSLKTITLGGTDAPDNGSGRQISPARPAPEGDGDPDRPDRFGPPDRRGPGANMVPGNMLEQYLNLNSEQKIKLNRLFKVMEALRRENFALPEITQLKLTEDQIRKIAEGAKVKEVLTAEQNAIMEENPRPARGGPGAPPPPPR